MAGQYPENEFWNFSLKIYGGDGVSRAFINIQDRHQMDVNMLLLGIWFGSTGRGQLSQKQVSDAIEITSIWNQKIVCNLRDVRDRLKERFEFFSDKHTQAMRSSVLALEIECENIEHLALANYLGEMAEGIDKTTAGYFPDVAENIFSYFRAKKRIITDEDLDDLFTILKSVFPEQGPEEIVSILKR